MNRLGVFQGFTNRLRLIARLMADRRVNPLIKLIPVGALIYLVVPTDLMPLLPFDDAAVLWLGSFLFVEMCPQDVVREHTLAIEQAGASILNDEPEPDAPQPDVIDAEFHEVSGSPEKDSSAQSHP
jgi:uncharacterized membrane protein YkvA (DUF1232 family)